MKSYKIEVYGRVQSVGFRPFIYNLAKKYNLFGYVKNKTSYVEIVITTEEKILHKFLENMKSTLPYPAKIDKIYFYEYEPKKYFSEFEILESEDEKSEFIYIPADVKICQECLKELFNPHNRRYLYPFINCTHCGPRFTIIKTLPYDRENTTMDIFQMCEDCYKEYTDPKNRRFHAQPNACHICGPGLKLELLSDKLQIKDDYKNIFTKTTNSSFDVKKVLEFVVQEIINGKIFAIKSYGGYHLVCDATNDEVVLRLRKNKYREFKPFAMMVSDIEVIKKYCYVNKKEEEILNSSQAPIVLLEKKENFKEIDIMISQYVAEKNKYFGFMLPYTPLHYLIFYWLKKYNKNIPLVMTSGNISDEPQVYNDTDAEEKFKNIADYILSYNRDINIRCDDSVVRIFNNDIYFIRRSRGWAPEPIFVDYDFKKKIFSFGAELKNTFAFGTKNYIILSHHIGDLDNLESINSYEDSIRYYLETFKFSPEIVVYDLHPLYMSSKIAKEFAQKYSLKSLSVQHHYAHMLSCMLDNNIFEKSIGIIFDGTGYGLDGKIWGSEFFVADIYNFRRVGYFDYLKLISADKSIKEPYRIVLANLYDIYKDDSFIKSFIKKFFDYYTNFKQTFSFENFIKVFYSIKFLVDNDINISYSCGMGRIFDLVAVLSGIGLFNYYEGQLPQELEFFASKSFNETRNNNEFYEYKIFYKEGSYIVDTKHLIKQIIEDLIKKEQFVEKEKIASKFHYTIVKICLDIVLKIRNELNINKVVLSGGVFNNNLLLSTLVDLLKKNNFEVFTHKKFPCNDGGISLGQLVLGNL
ncbi:MAG: carbamoyltransferase HypF [Endomicrobiia bacterium]